MENHICAAGVNESNIWRRPVRLPAYNLSRDDIFNNEICVIKPYNVVRFKVIRSLQNIPQSEDFLVDWSFSPTIVSIINEQTRLQNFKKIDESKNIDEIEDGISHFLIENNRSLLMVKPNKIFSCSYNPAEVKGFKTRLRFELNNIEYNLSCTDIRWRAYMKIEQNRNNLRQLFKGKEVYLSIGLTREWQEKFWPMVIGVHMIPDFDNIEIDYNNL